MSKKGLWADLWYDLWDEPNHFRETFSLFCGLFWVYVLSEAGIRSAFWVPFTVAASVWGALVVVHAVLFILERKVNNDRRS